METAEILQELGKLPIRDRLTIAETALQLIQAEQHSLIAEQRKRQLAIAATTAISDYAPDSQLLAFSTLDGKDFYDDPDDANLNAHA
jgi:hypothetical protein